MPSIITAMGLVLLFTKIEIKNTKVNSAFNFLGSSSMLIYVLHGLILSVFYFFIANVPIALTIGVGLTFIFSLGINMPLNSFIHKINEFI